ncbi:MAG: hypothetical protein HC887_01510, partial [Desulfobacteraceae bacterium]|nr:hypothetical protein [Desulfobacteraceae bacterium]
MKTKHYHISLYVIIPIIFAGYALFASILSFRITQYCIRHGLDYTDPIFWTLAVISVVGFACGLAIVWVILKPVQSFIEKARQLSAISIEESGNRKGDEIGNITRVFEQVTSVLSMVDARQLFPDMIAESKAMRWDLGKIM